MSVYRFISAEKARTRVSMCCELLGVSRSGYDDWATRAPSDRRPVTSDPGIREGATDFPNFCRNPLRGVLWLR